MSRLAANLQRVRARIAAAAARAGRAAGDVRLVAVTKYVEPEVARALVELGQCDLGESRPQELWRKAEALADLPQVCWHFIGHLQRNKLARTLPHVALLHSADSLRLLQAVDEFGRQHGRRIAALVEVNISGDASKHGFAPDDLLPLRDEIAQLTHVDVRGLMGMSSLDGSMDDARREFSALRQLRDRLRGQWPENLSWNELSMGMSDDLEAAIEAGATLVRVGSALFEGCLP